MTTTVRSASAARGRAVSHQHHAATGFAQGGQQGQHRLLGPGVQVRRRLVQDDQRGLAEQHPVRASRRWPADSPIPPCPTRADQPPGTVASTSSRPVIPGRRVQRGFGRVGIGQADVLGQRARHQSRVLRNL